MWRWLLGWLLVTGSLSGCDDGARSRIDGADPDRGAADGAIAADGPLAIDAALAPDAAPPDDMGPRGECRFEVEYIPTAARADREPIVDGDTVYFSEVGPEGFLRTVRARDRAPVAGPADRLVSIRDGAALIARGDGDGGRRLIYRDGDGDVPLADRFVWPWSGEIAWRPPQWVEPGRAIWITDGRLYRWQGGAVEQIDEGVLNAVVHGGRLAWTRSGPPAAGGGFELWMDGVKRLDGAGDFPSGGLMASGDRVWVAARDRVSGVAWGDAPEVGCGIGAGATLLGFDAAGEVAVVVAREGPDGAAAAFLCGARSSRLGWGTSAVPRWLGGEVVFAEWDDPDAWCGPTDDGRLGWPGPNGLTEVPLASVTAGCLCCGAYWPPFTFEAGRDTLAWNYAVGPEPGWGIGIARRVCE